MLVGCESRAPCEKRGGGNLLQLTAKGRGRKEGKKPIEPLPHLHEGRQREKISLLKKSRLDPAALEKKKKWPPCGDKESSTYRARKKTII